MPESFPAPNSEFAPAKLNLYLHITGKRADGYHLLDSLAVFLDAGDQLTVEPAEDLDLSLNITGPYAAALGDVSDNLVTKAAKALADARVVMRGAKLTLHKNLPVGAGLGGGSADAAAALRLLNRFWKLNASEAELQRLGATLGSDIPVCVVARPAVMSGMGEMVQPVRMNARPVFLLVNPNLPLLTADVFRAYRPPFSDPAPCDWNITDLNYLLSFLRETRNDLEAPAQQLMPLIGEVLAALQHRPGCLLARMSGSGATCFAMFARMSEAQAARENIMAAHPGWWAQCAQLREGGNGQAQ